MLCCSYITMFAVALYRCTITFICFLFNVHSNAGPPTCTNHGSSQITSKPMFLQIAPSRRSPGLFCNHRKHCYGSPEALITKTQIYIIQFVKKISSDQNIHLNWVMCSCLDRNGSDGVREICTHRLSTIFLDKDKML